MSRRSARPSASASVRRAAKSCRRTSAPTSASATGACGWKWTPRISTSNSPPLPDAKFILTVRECVSWVDSEINHFLGRPYPPQAGLTHARLRALAEAAGDILSFIDDDNWVCPDWVQKVADFMATYPEVGALGSYNYPVSDKAFPEWFPQSRHYFAVAGDDVVEGDITETGRMLVGAGFSLRKTAARGLLANGFRFSLSGRSGRAMSSGEDQELCLALQLTGWRLWFTREISLQHFLPEGRLSMRYVRGLLRGIGRSSVMLDPYLFLLEQRRGLAVKPHQAHWLWRALASLKDFVIHRFRGRMIQSERALGRLEMLCRLRGEYHERFAALARVPWLRIRSE